MIDFDLKLDESGDVIYVDGPDILKVTGGELVAQDIKRHLEMPLGVLPWDARAGSRVCDAIGDNVVTNIIEQEMFRIARTDDRIDQESVKVVSDAQGNPALQFVVRGDTVVQEVSA